MAEEAIIGTNINQLEQFGYIDNFNAPNPNQPQPPVVEIPQEEPEPTDLVELSPESMNLSRLNAEESLLPVENLTETTETAVETAESEEPLEETIVNQAGEEAVTVVAGETTTAVNIIAENAATPVNTTTGAEENVIPAAETGETVLETEPPAPEATPLTVAPPQTAEGTVMREPQPTEEPVTEAPETPPPIEAQAEELTRLNETLNISSGATAPTGENAVNAANNSEIAPESQRNEQQVLLQNVGSQLAQAAPLPSIISVLG